MLNPKLIQYALNFIAKFFIAKIKNAAWQNLTLKNFKKLTQAVIILVDKDLNNKEQLQELFEKEKVNLLDDSLEAAILIIENKMPENIYKNFILDILRGAEQQVISTDETGIRGIIASSLIAQKDVLISESFEKDTKLASLEELMRL